jgi:hypothetical protein
MASVDDYVHGGDVMRERYLAIDAMQVFIMKYRDVFDNATIVETEDEENVLFTSTSRDGRKACVGYKKIAPKGTTYYYHSDLIKLSPPRLD